MPVWATATVLLLLLTLLVLWLAARYLFHLALHRSSDKMIVLRNIEAPSDPDAEDLTKPYSAASIKAWREELAQEGVFRTAPDGTRLYAAVAEAPGGGDRWAVVMHGYTMRYALSIYAKHFHDAGYNLLVPSQRGHNESGGDYITMGWQDRLDLVDWINWLVAHHPKAKIVIHGVSMGGTAALMAAGEPLPDNVRCVVSDCAFSSVREQFAHQLKYFFKLPAFPLLNLALIQAKHKIHVDFAAADAAAQLRKTHLPILFIHGDKDRFVPPWMQDVLYEAAAGPKERLRIENAGHGLSVYHEPERYWNAIEQFIERYL